jgi:hypothetical protein
MGFLAALWLPIVLSAVIVFVASSILHMVLKYHQSDCFQLPNEEQTLGALRSAAIKPGYYHFPYTTHKDMKSPATQEKFKRGPVGFLTVLPSGPPAMGKYLGGWFGYCLVIAFFTAYITFHSVPQGANYLFVFRIAGATAFMAYGLGPLANSIWKGQPWSMTIKEVFDGLIYGLLVGGTFGWLWPR